MAPKVPKALSTIRAYLDAGHTVYELADAAGIPRSTLQSWLDRGVPLALHTWERVESVCEKGKRK